MALENNSSKNRIAAIVALLLFIGSFIYLAVEMRRNIKLEEGLKNEKLTAESLLSEKLLLNKEVMKIKSEVKSLARENSYLDKTLIAKSKNLEAAELDLRKSQNQHATVTQLRKHNQELSNQKEALDQELVKNKTMMQQLQSVNADLEIATALLQEQNKDLIGELNTTRLSSMNEILMESTKKSSKLTVKATRTKNLIVHVDVPAEAENLNFIITSPSGKELTDKEGTIAIDAIVKNKPRSKAFYVAGSSLPPLAYNQVQMTYVAKDKLAPGTYDIQILNNSMFIGRLKLKLR